MRESCRRLQQAGAQPQEMQDLQDKINLAIQSFRGEKNLNHISSLDRLTELMENLSLLTTEMGANYLELRHTLEAATSVTKSQVDVQTKAAEASNADLMEEQKKHAEERQMLLTKVDTAHQGQRLKADRDHQSQGPDRPDEGRLLQGEGPAPQHHQRAARQGRAG